MESTSERTVRKNKVDSILLSCIQKVNRSENKHLCLLNKAYREAEHDLALLEQVGVITKKDMESTIDKMRFHYVEKALKMSDYDECD